MTKTIQKRADELKPGDVLTDTPSFGARVVLKVLPPADADSRIAVRAYSPMRADIDTYWIDPDVDVPVEFSQLVTREQLDLLLDIAAWFESKSYAIPTVSLDGVRQLLDELRPPSPPTLEEALQAMQVVINADEMGSRLLRDSHRQMFDALIDRARRSGKL